MNTGDQIGPYAVLEQIGRGGMGEVWKARDTRLDRIVAIKTSRQQFSERFEREARAVAALNHPNICTLHDVGPNYLVMEFVEGAPLKGPLPLEEVLRLGHQLTDALEAAHEKHITHRDLKPGNIMLKPDGSIKVLDFGLAKISAPARTDVPVDESPTLTMGMTDAGTIVGTAAYMAPEQAKGKEVDKRADIWAFGVVLYELVTGSRPFQGGDMAEILASVIKEQPPYESVPHELRRLLKKCLEKDPAKRLRDIGDVWELLDAAPAPVANVVPVVRVKRSWWPWAVTAAAVAGLAALAALHFREEPPPLTKLEFAPPDNGRIIENSGPPAVSPDGRHVAFRAQVDGKSSLWVRDLDSPVARPLPGTEGPQGPFWSPDSRSLGFVANGKLMKIDVTGGPAITLANTAARGGTWSSDGTIIFVPLVGGGLAKVPAGGGAVTPVSTLDASRKEVEHRLPLFLPDGRHFLYLVLSGDREQSAVFAGDLQDPKLKTMVVQAISNVQYSAGHLLFIRERTLMAQPFDASALKTTGDARPIAERVTSANNYGYFSSSPGGVLAYTSGSAGGALQVTWFDRSGKVVGTVGKPADVQGPRLSPDGKMVATDRLDSASGNRDIWIHDLARGTEQRLTFEANNRYPVWSPDSQRIAYIRQPDPKVVVRAANGTGTEEILESAAKLPMDWTRDGGFLLSVTPGENPKTGNDIWSMPMTGDRKPLALRQTDFTETSSRVSPDGRWMAYQSNESKRPEIYVVGFPGINGKWQVSANGGRLPIWSRDGRELYFVGADDKLMAVPYKSGTDFQPGNPQPLFDVRLGATNPSYDVSADGRFLIATPVEQGGATPMTVVLNWQQALK